MIEGRKEGRNRKKETKKNERNYNEKQGRISVISIAEGGEKCRFLRNLIVRKRRKNEQTQKQIKNNRT